LPGKKERLTPTPFCSVEMLIAKSWVVMEREVLFTRCGRLEYLGGYTLIGCTYNWLRKAVEKRSAQSSFYQNGSGG